MSTRAASVDPGLVLWLLQGRLDLGEVAHGLEHDAGLAGLAGGAGDMRDVVAGVERGDPASCLAFDVHAHRLRREVAAMAAALGGLDVVVFRRDRRAPAHRAGRGGGRARVPGDGRRPRRQCRRRS